LHRDGWLYEPDATSAWVMPDLTRLIETWGYVAVAIVVVLGNVGVPVPEETVLALGGYLSWVGRLRWLPLLAVGFVSAVVGDNIGYWLGRRYGRAWLEWLARRLAPGRFAYAERFVARYGALAVFVARFITGLRMLAGPLAGALGLPFPRFFIANVCGAALFVPYAVGLGWAIGYGLGPRVERLHRLFGGVEWFVLGVVALLVAWFLVRHVLWPRRRQPP
jgi:membrane protein DedA with SNARE-associated domain